MIGDALYAEMKAQAVRLRRGNALLRRAAEGTLTERQIAHYLANTHHLLNHTPVFLAHARERALAAGEVELAKHYRHKDIEEDGHNKWSERDLSRMSRRAPDARREIVPAIHELIALTMSVIDEHPALILAYMFFNESLIVLLGPEFLAHLEERCGIPRTSMTAVGNHVELDRDHVDEALALIDDLVPDPTMLPRMRQVVRDAIAIFERFSEQITTDAPAAAHVTAA